MLSVPCQAMTMKDKKQFSFGKTVFAFKMFLPKLKKNHMKHSGYTLNTPQNLGQETKASSK